MSTSHRIPLTERKPPMMEQREAWIEDQAADRS